MGKAGWMGFVASMMLAACAAPTDVDAAESAEDAVSTARDGSYLIATCKAGSVETFESIRLTATLREGRVISLASVANDYRGALNFQVASIGFLPQRGGGLQTIISGEGRIGGRQAHAVDSIILDPSRQSAVLIYPRNDGGSQIHTNCAFSNLGLFAARTGELAPAGSDE